MTAPLGNAIDRCSINGKFANPAERTELLVIGAGQAGSTAALEAARAGLQVMLVDENPIGAGLIGLDVPLHFGGRATTAVHNRERMIEQILGANPLLGQAYEAGVDVRLGTYAWGAWVNGPGLQALPVPVVGLADETRSWLVGFDRLIVAAGARDLNLSFAGSDQPGVVGAQGLHSLLARYEAFAGRRLVVLGSGRLAVETATLALDHGLEVAALVEIRDAPEAPPELIASLQARGVEVITRHAPLRADGGVDGVKNLVIAALDDPSRQREIACDTVCLALGAVPSIELLDVLGVALELDVSRGGFVPQAGPDGETSLDRVFVAGDCAGIGGDAQAQGRAAAHAVSRTLGRAAGEGAAAPRLTAASDPTNAVMPGLVPGIHGNAAREEDVDGRDEPGHDELTSGAESSDCHIYQLDWARALMATGGCDVLACICEDVTRDDLLQVRPPRYLGWQSGGTEAPRDVRALLAGGPINQDQIKRLTRACMGPCQARRCREQVALLLALAAEVPVGTIPLTGYRAPVRPLPLSVLADSDETREMAEGWNVWFGIASQWVRYEDIGTRREAEFLRAGMPY